MDNPSQSKIGNKKWLKSMGLGAILFFSIKGLIWVAVFFGLFKFVGC